MSDLLGSGGVVGLIRIRGQDLLAHKPTCFWREMLRERSLPPRALDADGEPGDQLRFTGMCPIAAGIYHDMIHSASSRLTLKWLDGLRSTSFNPTLIRIKENWQRYYGMNT